MMKYKTFILYLTAKGCTLHRTSGKHHIYTHPKINRNIVIPKQKEISQGVIYQTQKLLANV